MTSTPARTAERGDKCSPECSRECGGVRVAGATCRRARVHVLRKHSDEHSASTRASAPDAGPERVHASWVGPVPRDAVDGVDCEGMRLS